MQTNPHEQQKFVKHIQAHLQMSFTKFTAKGGDQETWKYDP